MNKKDKLPLGVFEDMDNEGVFIKGPPVYSLYNRPPRPKVDTGKTGGADQSFKDECDIKVIMRRAQKTGVLIDPAQIARASRVARYEDVSAMPESFMDAQIYVQEVSSMFNELPSRIRQKFNNDARKLLEFLADDSNRKEAIELGLVAPAPAPGAAGGSGAPDVKPAGDAGKPA